MTSLYRALALPFALPFLLAAPAAAVPNSAPATVAPVDTIPAARDIDYPGTIQLEVDVSDVERAVFKVREIIPVAAPGRMTLLLPKWLPGHHGPDGEPDKIAGIEFFANGAKLSWLRDPVDTTAYHVEVPAGAAAVEARFSYLSPLNSRQGRVVVTPELLNLQWESASLYPAGYHTRRIPVAATLILPKG
jgi:predicted metalloprotease with PDZ domain